MIQAIESIEPYIVNDIIREVLEEIIEWIEHQDKPDSLQIYIKLKTMLNEGENA